MQAAIVMEKVTIACFASANALFRCLLAIDAV